MPRLQWFLALVIVCLFITLVSGAVIFSDDFSDAGQTNLKWLCPFPAITRVCENGTYTILNNSSSAGFVHNTFTAPKPSVFTASGKITRTSENISAGIFVSFNAATATGYLVQAAGLQTVQLIKYPADEDPAILLVERNAAVAGAGTNELKISKKDDSITVFCNGAFIGVVIDESPVPDGDLALLVPGTSTAVFDDMVVTDEWTGLPDITTKCFRDDFDDSQITGWIDIGKNYQKEESEGYLKLTTTNPNAFATLYSILNQHRIDTFAIMSSFSHRSGDPMSMYGIYIIGTPLDDSTPRAFFCINAARTYDAYTCFDTIRPQSSTAIRGAAFENNYYHDTIEVVKNLTGPSPYRMYVNNTLLDSLAAPRFDSSGIFGVGIYAGQGLVVWSDYFQYGPDRSICPVVMPLRIYLKRAPRYFTPYASQYLFDPMGRIVRTRKNRQERTYRALVPGFYIMPNGKNGIILKKP
ncbi:MAG: hypothetical protein JW768_00995 [Chitinispirillaceae bacterium]|nr:hypothetical protein [Chitinispirillaceae bacterium]